ncbi:Severe Depolymerization of Actin [Sorochytrium milnesiophthora]
MRSLDVNLPQLQNLIKRDPVSYEAEAVQQLNHVHSLLQIVRNHPQQPPPASLTELLPFAAHIIPCYSTVSGSANAQGKKKTKTGAPIALCQSLPLDMAQLLHLPTLHHDTRRSAVAALILLANRGVVDRLSALPLFFSLLRCHDKQLRQQLYTHIVNDLKNANNKAKNNKLNKHVLNFLFSFISPPPGYKAPPASAAANAHVAESHADALNSWSPIAARLALQICVDLYKKQIWNDTKTVNVIADACFSPSTKIMTTAAHFFLGDDNKDDDDNNSDDEDDSVPDLTKLKHQAHINKKTKSAAKKLKSALATIQRKDRKSKNKQESTNFSAIHLLHDPQTFAEKLFHLVKNPQSSGSSNLSFEVKLTLISLITRLVASHRLLILPLYPYLQKFLQPHQKSITSLLAYTAQSAHDLVPPDVVAPVVRTLADNFVNDHSSPEVVSAGLNSIRELVARCPLAMDQDLLGDLTQYKAGKDKGVVAAARGLVGLFREVNPAMLARSDRGRTAQMELRDGKAAPKGFGQVETANRVAGAELLEQDEEGEAVADDDDAAWQGWEVASSGDGSDDEGGQWVEMPDDGFEWATDSDEDSDEEDDEVGSEEDGSEPELELDDSEDGEGDDIEDAEDQPSEEVEETATLPIEARKFLTPADFARMAQLRATAAVDAAMSGGPKSKKRTAAAAGLPTADGTATTATVVSEFVDETTLVSGGKKRKSTYDERMASIMAGREGREKYGSRRGKQGAKGNHTASMTNHEKRKTKNYMMMVHGKKVHTKKKMSLRDKQKVLRSHIKKQKMKK